MKKLLEDYGVAKPKSKQSVVVDTHDVLGVVLSCAKEAIEGRGLGEEKYMEPLFERYRERKNPAQMAIDVANVGGMASLIEHATIKI